MLFDIEKVCYNSKYYALKICAGSDSIMTKRKRRFGDRYDGRLLRSLNPFYKLVPYILRTRTDSQNLFDEKFDITATETFLRSKRNTSEINLTFLHVLIAAMVRTVSQKPGLNRFIAGQKIYARNQILVSLVVKKQMSEAGEETTIKIPFEPTDTLYDVAYKVNKIIDETKHVDLKNDADKTAKMFMKIPGPILRFTIWLIRSLDYNGMMPKALNIVSPFHTSVFITDLGSLGIEPVYHHLYEFGTTSTFLAFGMKLREKELDENNNPIEKKYMNMRIVTDERIVDGYNFASAFKLFKKLLQNPEKLLCPPDSVVEDIN